MCCSISKNLNDKQHKKKKKGVENFCTALFIHMYYDFQNINGISGPIDTQPTPSFEQQPVLLVTAAHFSYSY